MPQLSPTGQQIINDIAQRHGFSVDATLSMLDLVINGNGSQAQFNHPEFSGSGQWMRKVAAPWPSQPVRARHDNRQVAFQPALPEQLRRAERGALCVLRAGAAYGLEIHGRVTVYDTLDHQIRGFG